ncbi:cation acetate symporter, partial [Streptomyces polyrhachis]
MSAGSADRTWEAAVQAQEHRPLIVGLFSVFVLGTLAITLWAARGTKSATDYYAGGRSFTGFQNGL